MFRFRWLPWKFVVRKLARAHGFLDPIVLLAQLQRFTQPSEVQEPIELLRAGVVLHARGLVNSRVIQHNLDWVWPYWVEQQFDPTSRSFIPRAFSITHINLTHRNWTAVGVPGSELQPIVDPRGLLTPLFDQWSLDAWVLRENGELLLPAREAVVEQSLGFDKGLNVVTSSSSGGCRLQARTYVDIKQGMPTCVLELQLQSDSNDCLVLSLRPYNPEGVSFVHELALSEDRRSWTVDKRGQVLFDRPVTTHLCSNYLRGDVYSLIRDRGQQSGKDEPVTNQCEIGLLTAAALFPLRAGQAESVRIEVPLESGSTDRSRAKAQVDASAQPVEALWENALAGVCQLQIADAGIQKLFDTAIRTLILHSVDKVYPGPYTYKRFWYRDATFIIRALLALGLFARAEKALDYFPVQQTALGYFHSQEGEWDSNGQALWIYSQFSLMTNQKLKPAWRKSMIKGARWLADKRSSDASPAPHAGLLPAGFSAEHLGPIDYYYWDNYWAVAGLSAAGELARLDGDFEHAEQLSEWQTQYSVAIERSLQRSGQAQKSPAIPASPYRRLDAGAIGSIVGGYPLCLCDPDDPQVLGTVEFLLRECMVSGGFFQDMIHSGINPYLTLHLAQVLLRAADPRFYPLMTRVAQLASATGQWPEAIHPITFGGCMGDGQHAWAAAEWIMMIRNCFVREEGDRLIIASGVPAEWWHGTKEIIFGPAATRFGMITLRIKGAVAAAAVPQQRVWLSWDAKWHKHPPTIEVRLPGYDYQTIVDGQSNATVERNGKGDLH